MLKKALVYLLFATLALILTAAVAVFLILKLALAPGRDEWPARFQAGPVAVDVGVPTAIRLATSSWFAPWLAGRTLDTPHGPVRVKIKFVHDKPLGATPEYDDCKTLADASKLPVRQIWEAATVAAQTLLGTLRKTEPEA